jgi:DNA mismatch endonuclease (patch repair protein)
MATRNEITAEQDEAAGGRDKRMVHLPDGKRATASVQLQPIREGIGYSAALRYKSGGKTTRLRIGRVGGEDRVMALREAWAKAHDRRLLE